MLKQLMLKHAAGTALHEEEPDEEDQSDDNDEPYRRGDQAETNLEANTDDNGKAVADSDEG